MKKQYVTVYCHAKDCLEEKKIEFIQGEFQRKWYCFKHAYMFLEEERDRARGKRK